LNVLFNNRRPVIKKDIQDFMKRYRAYLDYHYGKNKKPIKYMATAEYGDRTHRAHYHVLIFGHVFNDRVPYKKSKRGNQIYMSLTVSALFLTRNILVINRTPY
jgi:hypothetical protein